jgi:hypothetical protein
MSEKPLPAHCPFPVEQVLAAEFWPEEHTRTVEAILDAKRKT